MQEYANKDALIDEINKRANLFIKEFTDITEADIDIRFEEVERTPREIIAYQLGWMKLIRGWDRDELAGKEVITPALGYKWNRMGEMYQKFYEQYQEQSLAELCELFVATVDSFLEWLKGFSDDELFLPAGRKWAASTASSWSIWKWVHINTVSSFKTFRTKIRKWKKIRAEM